MIKITGKAINGLVTKDQYLQHKKFILKNLLREGKMRSLSSLYNFHKN